MFQAQAFRHPTLHAGHSMRSRPRAQQGLTLIEVIIALAILGAAAMGASRLVDNYSSNMRANVAAGQLEAFGDAVNSYVEDNYAAVEGVATASTPALITVPILQATGYLSSGFFAQNGFGQTMCALVLQPTSGHLQGLVVTQGGQAINDLDLGQIAGLIGGGGGGVYSTSPTELTGTMGGWKMPIGNYANPDSAGEQCSGASGSVSITTGHPVEALWFAKGDETAGVLYRDSIPGQSQRNTMNTPILVSSSAIETSGATCSPNGQIARDSNGGVLACVSGTWQSPGSLYWKNPVNTFSALPTTDPVGAVRMTLDTGRAFMWTGGAWSPLAVDQNGNLDVPNNLTAAGGHVIAWNQVPEGGVLQLVGANGVSVYLESNNGTFRLVNSPWNAQLFAVDQSGNVYATGTVYAPNASISGSTWTNYIATNNATINGQTSTGDLQLNYEVTAGTGCSPDGLVARSTAGDVLNCQSGVWKDLGTVPFSVSEYNVGQSSYSVYLGVHAYCALSFLDGGPLGGFQQVWPSGDNWYANNYPWGGYQSGSVISVMCINLPGAGM